ncbi:hypothetical protein ONZ45_g11472 [Pleurotus djamor]|nr:hypothetical protein ONZ45_g11472 [Pleurotus djamor]
MAFNASSEQHRMLGPYILTQQLSGCEWSAHDRANNKDVRLKIEQTGIPGGTYERERRVLARLTGEQGFPTLLDDDTTSNCSYLATEPLGLRMDTVHNGQPMNIGLASAFAIQMLGLLKVMHSKHFVHGNVSLQSIFLGIGSQKYYIHLSDFSVSRLVNEHIPANEVLEHNPIFSSLRVHYYREAPTFIDDVESLALVLIHLVHPGCLPWAQTPTSPLNEDLASRKLSFHPEDLGNTVPPLLQSLFSYCRSPRSPRAGEFPDYDGWIRSFRSLKFQYTYPPHDRFLPQLAATPSRLSTPSPATSPLTHWHTVEVNQSPRTAVSSHTRERQGQRQTSPSARPTRREFDLPTSDHHPSSRSFAQSSNAGRPTPRLVSASLRTLPMDTITVSSEEHSLLLESSGRRDATPRLPTPSAIPLPRSTPRSSASHSLLPQEQERRSHRGSTADLDEEEEETRGDDDDEGAAIEAMLLDLEIFLKSSTHPDDVKALKKSLLLDVHSQIESAHSMTQLATAFKVFTMILRRSSNMSQPTFAVLACLQHRLYPKELDFDDSGDKQLVIGKLSSQIRTAKRRVDVAKMLARFHAIMAREVREGRGSLIKIGHTFLERVTEKLATL